MTVGRTNVTLVKPQEITQPIDIIVPTHGHLELTMRCVNSIYENTSAPFHLIVVDDSTDLTPLYFKDLKKEHENITFVHSEKPYTSGNQIFNIGLKHGVSDYIATVMNEGDVFVLLFKVFEIKRG